MLRRPYLVMLLLLGLVWLAGCGGGSAVDSGVLAAADLAPVKSDPIDLKGSAAYDGGYIDFTWDLIAGQNMHAGTVHVYNDADWLYVAYELFDGWLMEEAHVLVSTTEPGKKDGKPGRFPYKMEFDPPVDVYTFEIPLDGLDAKQQLYIATHAATTNGETIWGGDWNGGDTSYDFEWKKWGGGFCTNVMPVFDPAGPYRMRGTHGGQPTYWTIWFDPDTYPFPGNNSWYGWCTDPESMGTNWNDGVWLYSCYDPNLPAYAQSDNWDVISYILNQRNQGAYAGYSRFDIQRAIWYFKYGTGTNGDPISANAQAIIDDAVINGEDYIPGVGEYYAVICWPGLDNSGYPTRFQMNIIEVDP